MTCAQICVFYEDAVNPLGRFRLAVSETGDVCELCKWPQLQL